MIWNGDQFLSQMREQYAERVGAAGDYLASEMKIMVGVQGPPRSTPGNPPHMDTQALRDSIASIPGEEGDVIFADVGTDVFYGIFLEEGTQKMAARPWCLKTLKESQGRVAQIIERGQQYDISIG